MHHTTALEDNPAPSEYELVCVKSDSLGAYNAPIIMGSVVHAVKVKYNDHTFVPSIHNGWNYKEGVLIGDSEIYSGHDFMDASKVPLYVEVVGGECSKPLGSSKINVKIKGCDWQGDTYDYSGVQKIYNNVPATLVKVQVTSNDYPHIESYFQNGDSPRTVSIDLTEKVLAEEVQEEMNEESNTGVNTQVDTSDASDQLEDEEAKESLVRLQYDGVLTMDVHFTDGVDDDVCSLDKGSDYLSERRDEGDSFHGTASGALISFTVMPKFELFKGQYCDIVGDEYKVRMINNVGVDENAGWDEFFQGLTSEDAQNALTICAEGCSFDVDHNTNDGKNTGGAHVNLAVAVGRPNISYPFTKNIQLFVEGKGMSVSHTAYFFVEGDYKKGPGRSFAIPEHEPVMVIRDPPGGSSYASYKNIQTEFRFVDASTTTSVSTGFQYENLGGGEVKLTQCFGLASLLCDQLLGFDIVKGPNVGFKKGGIIYEGNWRESNSYSTTWSYTTSSNTIRAGADSDVFVVPNLSVAYETVQLVRWSKETCSPVLDRNGDLPEDEVFEFENDDKKPALSFFSRHHIQTVKIPELKNALKQLELEEVLKRIKDTENENAQTIRTKIEGFSNFDFEDDTLGDDIKTEAENICKAKSNTDCSLEDITSDDEWLKFLFIHYFDSYNRCLFKKSVSDCDGDQNDGDWMVEFPKYFEVESMGNANQDDDQTADKISAFREEILTGLIGWKNALDREVEEDENVVLQDWFKNRKYDEEGKYLRIDNQESALAPKKLYSAEHGESQVNRLQFSGGSGMFEMTMHEEQITSYSHDACWRGCDNDFEGHKNVKFTGEKKTGGIVDKLSVEWANKIHVSHKSHTGESSNDSTEISFGLGDPDGGDEFVVDIFVDKKYGLFFFKTVGGISRCPHEAGTLPAEDPKLTLIKAPSAFVDPQSPMLFEVELQNLGEGLGIFQMETIHGEESLTVTVDGSYFLTEDGCQFVVPSDSTMRKEIAITRGPIAYDYKPVDLYLKTCDTRRESNSVYRKVTLYNDIEVAEGEENKRLKFLQPCPTIKWAGDLQRDRNFFLNLQAPELLPVEIFNNERIGGTLNATKEERRLEAVQLKYRRFGDVNWSDAYKSTADSIKMDFLQTPEDDYGYLSLEWDTESLADATYEIMVESQCELVNGGPELSRFREEIIVGVKDKIAPKQYGKALPLKDDILFGEEMIVLFSEKIDCSYPFKFDVTLEIQNFYDETTRTSCVDGNEFCHKELKKSRNDLQISCEGRKIGLIPDFTNLGDVEKFLGKSFRVEIGNEGGESLSHVFDVNGNKLEHNVKFDKSFLALDLYTVTAKIDVRIDFCPNWSDEEKTTELAAILGLSDSSRIKISDQRCLEDEASFILLITPPSTNNGRYLRNLFQKDSMSDLDSLQFLSKLREMNNHRIVNGRYLQEETQQVKITLVEIIPGEEDRIRLETPVELMREERHLKNIMSFEGDIHHIRENELPDDIVRNSKEEQSQIELLLMEQQKKLEEMRKEDNRKMEEMEAMRKEDNRKMEKMEAMHKEDAEKMEEMRKEDARALKEMQQKEHEEMKEVFMASIAIVIGSVVMIGGAMFMHFRRS